MNERCWLTFILGRDIAPAVTIKLGEPGGLKLGANRGRFYFYFYFYLLKSSSVIL